MKKEQNLKYQQEQEQKQELKPQEFHLSRRSFLGIGAGAAAGLALSPLTSFAATGSGGSKKRRKLLASTTSPIFQEPLDVYVGSTAENPYELAVDYLDEAISTPSGGVRQEVTMRYYSYNGKPPFVRTENHLFQTGPTFRFKASDVSENTLNIKLRNNLPLNEATHYPSAPPYPSTGSVGVADRPKEFNTTNLHFHGFHVSPLSRTPAGQVGSSLDGSVALSSDDIFVALHPKGEAGSTGEHLYQVVLPKFHAPGTHWYHPHQHGATALQVIDGMAGALIIEEEGDNVIPVDKDLVWIAQEVSTEDLVVQPDPELAPVPGDQMVYNCSPASYIFTINGFKKPTLKMQPGELQRWRFINATATTRGFIQLELRKVEEDGSQTVQDLTVIATDGISFYGQAPKVEPAWILNPANRADFLIQLQEPGTYQLWKKVWKEARGNVGNYGLIITDLMIEGPQQAQILATITVEGEPVTEPKTIPAIVPGEFPNYLKPIADDQLLRTEPDENGASEIYTRPLVFGTYKRILSQNCNFYMMRPGEEEDPRGEQFTKDIRAGKLNPGQANPNPRLLQINGVSFTPKSGENYISYFPGDPLQGYEVDEKKPYNPGKFVAGEYRNETIQLVKLNTCEEWIIYNYTNIAHPFHIHMAPFQVVEIYNPTHAEEPIKYDPETAPWNDTFEIPPFKFYPVTETEPAKEVPGYLKIRLRFTDFWGKYVFHCHLLAHEDQGMMQTIHVMNDRNSTGNNPFTQVETSTVSGPGATIGEPGALPANYYPPAEFEPIIETNIETFPPQVQVTSDGRVLGVSDPVLRKQSN